VKRGFEVTSSRELMEQRKPFEALERQVVERALKRPGELDGPVVDALRYVINFAKLCAARDVHGHDHDLRDPLSPFAWRVRETLEARLRDESEGLWAAARVLPELVTATRQRRDALVNHLGLDLEALNREVCTRKLVLVLGGGGGAGYGYAGVFSKLAKYDLVPDLICGTSIGALLGTFRARSKFYDAAQLQEANKRLSFNTVFQLAPEPSRYGLPATLRLHLRAALGDFLRTESGEVARINELAIPMRIIGTGLTVDAMRHSLDFYEHFLDDVVRPGGAFRLRGLGKMANLAQILAEFANNPQSLREVIFGADPGTEEMDVLDCAGFSASVPGLLHYDVHRDDKRMKMLLDRLYAERGITRLTEGGVVNNVPARVGFREAMEGKLGGVRNHVILAIDCFPPRASSLLLYPIQQIARANVTRNIPYATVYLPLQRTLSPMQLVASVEDVGRAGRWAIEELKPHMPYINRLMTPIAALA
jgi:predicted acylesterase/phospholipase RssA